MNTTWLFGASGTIGIETCNQLLERGDKVLAFCASNESKEKIDLKFSKQENFESRLLNLSSTSSIEEVVTLSAESIHKPKHVIFLARGSSPINQVDDDEEWVDLAVTDLMISLITPIRICLRLMSENNLVLSTITLVSSQYALVSQDPKLYDVPQDQLSAMYSAIRGGIISGVKALAVAVTPAKTRVNCLTLGGITESTGPNLRKSIEDRLPSERMISALDAANWLLFLASEKSEGAIGSSFVVDNGWTIF